MKICVLGLDCAAPEIAFGDDRLRNFRRLMERDLGTLESVIPPITVPSWMCLSTSQDPGSLGVYGFRNRINYTYSGLGIVDSSSIQAPAVWDYLGQKGKCSIVVGVPPGFPPRNINGISIGCFLTPDAATNEFDHLPLLAAHLEDLPSEPILVIGSETGHVDGV